MKPRRLLPILALFIGLTAVSWSRPAHAADGEDEVRSYKKGPTVRRKLLYRSSRVELQPMIGMTAGDAYMRNGILGVNASYFLTNEIGLGITAGYGLLHPETDMASNIKTTLARESGESVANLSFSYVQWMAGLEFEYVPIFGKFSLMNSINAAYDIHLLGGFTLVGRNSCSSKTAQQGCLNGSGQGDGNLNGVYPAGTIGLGMRLFVGEAYSVDLQVRDHLYRRAESSYVHDGSRKASPEFTNNFFVSLGFSFFLPQEVKISK